VCLLILAALICFIIGSSLIISVLKMIKREAKTKGEVGKKLFTVIFDVISDPISSEGLRILFGGILIGIGILLLFL
jgi:uncharacterized membrane-anchored protein YitT (DUF2179 family)